MTEGHAFEPTTLREYDIRGVVGSTLSEQDAGAVGRAFASILSSRGHPGGKVCVGYDGRESSPTLEAALVDGLRNSGCQVVRVGLGPTPMLYFAAKTENADGGIMVTGSHNPPDFNGFKMVMNGQPFYGADIQGLGQVAKNGDFVSGNGTVTTVDIQQTYLSRLLQEFRGGRELSVVWDAGNGAAGAVMSALAGALPGRHTTLFADIDGTFPNHHPDPTVADNLVDLIDKVRAEGADLGIAFDGDGDRIGVVDGQGRILWGDQLLCLLAEDLLSEQPGATIIADVKASQVLFDEVARYGGQPLMWKTGHSPIKQKMAETQAPLAGEMSGHIFFADRYYGFDDALYAAVRLLDIAARSPRSVAEMRDALPQRVNTPELRFDCDDSRKKDVVKEVAERLQKDGADVNAVDGVRVSTEDGWWLLRSSNTQPVLVARCESENEQGLTRLKNALVEQLLASGVKPPQF